MTPDHSTDSVDDSWRKPIQQLENRIDELIELCTTLRNENRALRGRVQQLTGERDQLHEKNQYAMKSVESILASVQVLESES